MSRKSQSNAARLTRRTFAAGVGAAGFVAGAAPFNILRAQGAPLKVGVLLPRSGLPGRHRPGLPARRQYRAGDPQIDGSAGPHPDGRRHRDQCRHRACARRAADRRGRAASGRRLRFRPDHRYRPGRRAEGHSPTSSISPRSPAITEQGYKFVFRNFPTGADDSWATPSPIRRRFSPPTGAAPKTVVFMHINDTFGTAIAKGIGAVLPKFDMPYKIVEDDRLRSGGARPVGRSGEGQGDRRRGAACGQPPQ